MKVLPFMVIENIMMNGLKRGGNGQELHEKIRVHFLEVAKMVKVEGRENDLVYRIANDPEFGISKEEILLILKPELYVGYAPVQVENFLG